jgi:hypothetical protein
MALQEEQADRYAAHEMDAAIEAAHARDWRGAELRRIEGGVRNSGFGVKSIEIGVKNFNRSVSSRKIRTADEHGESR